MPYTYEGLSKGRKPARSEDPRLPSPDGPNEHMGTSWTLRERPSSCRLLLVGLSSEVGGWRSGRLILCSLINLYGRFLVYLDLASDSRSVQLTFFQISTYAHVGRPYGPVTAGARSTQETSQERAPQLQHGRPRCDRIQFATPWLPDLSDIAASSAATPEVPWRW